MTWDYFVHVTENQNLQEPSTLPEGLAGGFVDEVSVRFFTGNKEGARNSYMGKAKRDYQIPQAIQDAAPDFFSLPSSLWLGLQVEFELLTPWYSRDDRVFHVMDNPVCKDRVFGVPFMSAASWKGLLRWALRMVTKQIGPELEKDQKKLDKDKANKLFKLIYK